MTEVPEGSWVREHDGMNGFKSDLFDKLTFSEDSMNDGSEQSLMHRALVGLTVTVHLEDISIVGVVVDITDTYIQIGKHQVLNLDTEVKEIEYA